MHNRPGNTRKEPRLSHLHVKPFCITTENTNQKEIYHVQLEKEEYKKHKSKAIVKEEIKLKHHPEKNCEKCWKGYNDAFPQEPR